MADTILERFLRYVAIDTQSDGEAKVFPSTEKQLHLLRLLADELRAAGVPEVSMDEHGYVMARIAANVPAPLPPSVGFIAHVDTSPDMPGCGVRPKIVERYEGTDIVLNKEKNIVLSPAAFPELREYTGHTLITTDGTTLLGADDKAGIAEIMCAVEHIVSHPELKHGDICIGFTPDEEIGHGVDCFDVAKFGATYAYTVDGGGLGELEYENFNAASAQVRIQGKSIHPGYAKNKMVNALQVAAEFNALLPATDRPEHTEGYEGFFHLVHMAGEVEKAAMHYLIRDHDREKFEARKELVQQRAGILNAKYGAGTVSVEVKDQYYNMRAQVEPHFHIVELAIRAMQQAGVKPLVRPIRGGTDGSRLSYMNLPCPNIFAGGHNFHGKYEFVSLQAMEKAVTVILNIVSLFAAQATGRQAGR
ncbi:MAG: peptidase T [Prevotellaceae bacterium]|jgi:tripeptide aminopeptidase|nr:peptidase T [Prevotellaceae bacterium]